MDIFKVTSMFNILVLSSSGHGQYYSSIDLHKGVSETPHPDPGSRTISVLLV